MTMKIEQLLKQGEDSHARYEITDMLRELIDQSEKGYTSLSDFSDVLQSISDKAIWYKRIWERVNLNKEEELSDPNAIS